MRRLLHVISFTSDLEASKAFYRDVLGLTVAADTPFMVNFATDGGGLMLLAAAPSQKREVELCFESDSVSAAVEKLRGRGVQFTDELRHLTFGSVIHFRDPEGNLLSILQPGTAGRGAAAEAAPHTAVHEGSGDGGRTATAVAEAPATKAATGAGTTPRISTAIVNCRDLAAARAYYAHLLGLHVSVDSPTWVQFDTGDIRLAIHSLRDRNATDLHLSQPMSFGFTVADLGIWIEAARARGVQFASVPIDEGLGLTAEIEDPEGNIVVVREPISEATLEERLAEAFEEDVPPRAAIRSPNRKAEHHVSWVAQRPDYKPPRRSAAKTQEELAAREERVAERAKHVASPRGTGPVRSRAKPKSLSDPKRAKTRPATGMLKKAEARTLTTANRAAASASKSRPLKRAASNTGARRTARKAAARKRGRTR